MPVGACLLLAVRPGGARLPGSGVAEVEHDRGGGVVAAHHPGDRGGRVRLVEARAGLEGVAEGHLADHRVGGGDPVRRPGRRHSCAPPVFGEGDGVGGVVHHHAGRRARGDHTPGELARRPLLAAVPERLGRVGDTGARTAADLSGRVERLGDGVDRAVDDEREGDLLGGVVVTRADDLDDRATGQVARPAERGEQVLDRGEGGLAGVPVDAVGDELVDGF